MDPGDRALFLPGSAHAAHLGAITTPRASRPEEHRLPRGLRRLALLHGPDEHRRCIEQTLDAPRRTDRVLRR
jgi:hypothetical protein